MIVPTLLLHIQNILKKNDIEAFVGTSERELQKKDKSFIIINQNITQTQTQNQYKNSNCNTIAMTTPIIINIISPSKQQLARAKTSQEQILNILMDANASKYYNPIDDTTMLLALTGVAGGYDGVDVNDRHILNITCTALWQTIQV